MDISISKNINRIYLIGVGWILLGSILFSTKAILVKLAYRYEVDSTSLLALRMLFALPIYLMIQAASKKQEAPLHLKRKDYLLIITIGLLGYYIASLMDFLGLQYVTAGIERLVLYVYPTLVLLISAWLFKRSIRRIEVLALLFTYVGVGVAFIDKNALSGSDNFWLGVFFVFIAAIAFALYIVGSGEYVQQLGTRRFTVWTMSIACTAIFIHHSVANQLQLFHFQTPVYLYAFLMSVIGTVLPSFMIAEGIRRIGASNAAIIGSIGPISTIILAYFFLGELFGWLQIFGTLLVIGGILILSLNKQKH